MPIKGLTTDVKAQFPTIGTLRKGGEAVRDDRGNVVKMGQDLSYFRFTSERPEVQASFEAAYGAQAAIIDVYLPHAGVEANFDCWREKWVQGGLVHRCDGETMTIWRQPDGTYSRDPKPCDSANLQERDRCKQIGRLSLILPELVKAGHVGYVTLQTSSINDLISIQASLLAAAEARIDNELGLRGIRWSLRRIREKVSTPMGNGKRARRDKWLVKLEPAVDWVTLQLNVAQQANMLQLPAPKVIDPNTGEINPPELEHLEPPEDYDEGEFIESDLPPLDTAGIPEPQDEDAAKQDVREKIEAVMAQRKLSQMQIDKWCQKHCQCEYTAMSLDGLLALKDALEAAAQKAS